jgi:hypothetical protein
VKIKYKTDSHKDPIVVKTEGTKEQLEAITPQTIDPKQIVREFVVSAEPLSETGNLFFKMDTAAGVRAFWMHLCTPVKDESAFVKLIEFPNKGQIKDPLREKVTVYRGEDRVVFDADAIMYVFLTHGLKSKKPLVADPHVTSIQDVGELAAELATTVLDQILSTGKNPDYEV